MSLRQMNVLRPLSSTRHVAINVLPTPGLPSSSNPLGIDTPILRYLSIDLLIKGDLYDYESILQKQVLTGFKETEGVEMEGYGVAYAATHAINPKPHVIIAKSVCDFADERKSDVFQQFAAYTSCGLVKDLLEKVLEYTGE